MQHSIMRKAVAAAAVAAVLFTGCAPDRGGDTNAGNPGGTGSNSATSAPGGSAATKFGDLDSPCGKGNAKGATDQGVTDTEIKIGYGDDRGFAASPGLNKEMGETMEAFIKWCNEQGGINGRKVVGKLYDAAITNVNTQMQAACKSEFMLVGQGFAQDAAAEGTRVGCNLVQVAAWTANADTAHAPMSFVGIPTPVDKANGAIWSEIMKVVPEVKADGVTHIKTTNPPLQVADARHAASLKTQGSSMKDCGVTLNYQGEPSYVPFAQRYKDCPAKVLWNGSTPGPQGFGMLQALNQVGAKPKLYYDSGWYKDAVGKWNTTNGNAADNMYIPLQAQPFENADSVPVVKQFVDMVTKAGSKPTSYGVYTASAFLLWAQAAKDCGSDLTRQCMVDKLSKVTKWTAGGLHAESNPGQNLPPKCIIVIQLKGDKFSQAAPAEKGKFACGELVDIPKEAQGGLVAGPDRISTKYDNPKVIKPKG